MNLSRTIPITVAALALLAGCGSAGDKAAGVRGPDTTTGDDSPLAAAQRECTDGAELLLKYNAVEESMIPTSYRNHLGMAADIEEQTDTEYIGYLADESATVAEDTLTVNNGYQQNDDGELLPTGLLAGLIQTCVLKALDTPPNVQEHIDHTRALDGIQEDAWAEYQVRWNYHPDSGMNLTIWTGQ